MLDILNGLDEAAWAGIAALLAVVVGGIGAAWKGTKKNPVDVGHPPPPTDLAPYILEELRHLNRKQEDQHDDQCRLLNRIYTDTQVIRERGPR